MELDRPKFGQQDITFCLIVIVPPSEKKFPIPMIKWPICPIVVCIFMKAAFLMIEGFIEKNSGNILSICQENILLPKVLLI